MANKYRKTHSTSLIIKKYRDRSEIPLDIYLSCYNQEIWLYQLLARMWINDISYTMLSEL